MTDANPQQRGPGGTRYSITTLVLCIILTVFGIAFLIVGLVQGNMTLAGLAGLILFFGIVLLILAIILLRKQKARLAMQAEARIPYEK